MAGLNWRNIALFALQSTATESHGNPPAPLSTPFGVDLADSYFNSRLFTSSLSSRDDAGRLIFKRDVCADVFGTGWVTSACTPGNTLCCVNVNQTYPQCQTYLGKGYCCVASDQGCYIDLPSSCNMPGAVSCPLLAPGVSQACCPQYTTCSPQTNATVESVRCNIQQKALQALAATTATTAAPTTTSSKPAAPTTTSSAAALVSATTTSSSATTQTTSTSPADSTKNPTSSLPASTPPTAAATSASPSSEASTGTPTAATFAGIAVGIALGVALLLVGAWFWHRRRARKLIETTSGADPNSAAGAGTIRVEKAGSDQPPPFNETRYEKGADESIHELYSRRDDAELAGCRSPRELADRKTGHYFVAELA